MTALILVNIVGANTKMKIINHIEVDGNRIYDWDDSKDHLVIIDVLCHECKDFLPCGDDCGICKHYGETLPISVSNNDFCSKGKRNNKDDCPMDCDNCGKCCQQKNK